MSWKTKINKKQLSFRSSLLKKACSGVGMRVSGGDLCEAEAPTETETAGETGVPTFAEGKLQPF